MKTFLNTWSEWRPTEKTQFPVPTSQGTCCQPPHPLTPHPTCWGRIRSEVHLREPSLVGGGRMGELKRECCNFAVSRRRGLRPATLSSPPPQSSLPQATSPTPRVPSPLEFHCKAKSGGWKKRGALRWLWEDLPPRLCPPGGLVPTTTTRLFSTPRAQDAVFTGVTEETAWLAFEWCRETGCPPSSTVGVDGYLSTPLTPHILCPCPGGMSDLLLRGGPGEVLSHYFMGS